MAAIIDLTVSVAKFKMFAACSLGGVNEKQKKNRPEWRYQSDFVNSRSYSGNKQAI